MGTRAGYIIRFTCPSCLTENAIINKTPKDFYRKIQGCTMPSLQEMFHGHDAWRESETGIFFRVIMR